MSRRVTVGCLVLFLLGWKSRSRSKEKIRVKARRGRSSELSHNKPAPTKVISSKKVDVVVDKKLDNAVQPVKATQP